MALLTETGWPTRATYILIMLTLCAHRVIAQGCNNDPCQNNGQCRTAILDPGYVCVCPVEFSGRNCERNITVDLAPVGGFQRQSILACSRVITGTSGTFTSPGYPIPSGHNLNCVYSMRIAEATTITLNLVFFDSEEEKDDLFYYQAPIYNFTRFLDQPRWNGIHTGETATFQTNQLTLLWNTDFNINSAGFVITYDIQSDPCVNSPCQNGGICNPQGLTFSCTCPLQYSGQFCNQVVVLVSSTVPTRSINTRFVEGRTVQSVTFDLTFAPSALSVGDVTGTGLWRVDTFLSSDASGLGTQLGLVEVGLSAQQGAVSWLPAQGPSTIPAIQEDIIVNTARCSEMGYLCARIGRGRSASASFSVAGDPTDAVLTGCTQVTCIGVEIIFTQLSILPGTVVREGFASNSVTFSVTLTSDAAAGSVSGSNLWKVSVFGSTNANGAGARTSLTTVSLNSLQSGADVVAGLTTQLQNMNVQWVFASGATCQQMPFFCVLVERGDNPTPDYLLSRPPEVVCQPITCRGVEVTGTSISVSSGIPVVENRNLHELTFDLNIDTSPSGGRVSGDDLWTVQLYASSSDISGVGIQTPSQDIVLTALQSGVDIINPGLRATLQGVRGSLALQGTVCRNLQYVCAVLGRDLNSDPSFTLSPSPNSNVLTSCTPVTCQGVLINSVGYTVTSGQPLQASTANNLLTLNLQAASLASGASVSGQNLWQVDIFTNTRSDGLGTTRLTQSAIIPFGGANTALTAGNTLNLVGLQANFDLTAFQCADIPFVCVRLSRNSNSNPEFTLEGVSSTSLVSCQVLDCNDLNPCENHQCLNGASCIETGITYVCQCATGWTGTFCQTPIDYCAATPCQNGGTCQNLPTTFQCTCVLGWQGDRCQLVDQGVIMEFVQLLINSGTVRQGSAFTNLNVNVGLSSNPAGSGISGTGLWQVTIFPNTQINGNGVSVIPGVTPVLTGVQSGTSLASGGQATILGVPVSLNLGGVTCSQIPYLCVRVRKGENPNPDFLLTGSLVNCIPSNCQGVIITDILNFLQSGFQVNENSNSNAISFTLRINSDVQGGSIQGTNLWAVNTFVSNQADGSGPRLAVSNNIPLTADQAGTAISAGNTAQIANINTNVDLGGVACSQFQYFCVELTRHPNPGVDFDVTFAEDVTCTPINCNGISITSTTTSFNGGVPLTSGETNTVVFDLSAVSNGNFAGVSGNNLWQVAVFTSPNINGAPSSGTVLAVIPGSQVGLDLTPGGTLDLTNLQATLDFTGLACADIGYVCFELQRNPAASVPFSLSGNTRECQLLSCNAPSACTVNPCLNGGVCFEQGAGFICSCASGWVGATCTIDDPCIPNNPCLNSGLCNANNDGTFGCTCINGYSGTICQIAPDPCNSFPCINGGTCNRLGTSTSYECTCPLGYSGQRCQDLDRCVRDSPCLNGAQCLPNILLGTYTCLCSSGFKGPECQFADSCFPNPCLNQGACFSDEFGQTFTCTCQPGFQGTLCEQQNLCFQSPCQNGGTCLQLSDTTRTCACLSQFSGDFCQYNNPCVSQPCLNGGICATSNNGLSYSCSCDETRWAGSNCQTAVVCLALPCRNGGICSPTADALSFTCQCPPGFSGPTCTVREVCDPNPCANGGTCVASGNTFQCICLSSFLGPQCQTPDPCQQNPCQNSGTCTPTSQGLDFTCQCPPSFTGPTCSFQDGCSLNPCQNGGICQALDIFGNFVCNCAPGFSGTTCTDFDPCGLAPCLNGGQCITDPSQQGGYRCICTSTFIGTNCGFFNLCSAAPCYNGGSCTPHDDGSSYQCSCTDQFVGDQCQLQNPCNPSPCLNAGTCSQDTSVSPPTFSCACPADFSGPTCAINLLVCPDPNDFMCTNGICIDSTQRCNNIQNCADFTDELNCPVPCLNGMFACTNILQCVSSFLVCDGVAHCQDSSDEGQICQNPCDPNPCQNGGSCSGAFGQANFTCSCAAGYAGNQCQINRAANDPPQFDFFTVPTFTITEGQSPLIVVGQLSATDPDNDPIIFGLEDDNARLIFTIDPVTGELYARPNLDREDANIGSRITVKVYVTDNINEPVRQDVIVEIRDVNDNPPSFTNLPAEVSIFENATFGTAIFQVRATDPDTGPGAIVSYQVSGVTPSDAGSAPTDYFAITSFSGEVQLVVQPLDYESIQQYLVTIIAQDYGSPSLTSTGTLTVNILDVQDTVPEFINIPYDVTIPETMAVDSVIQTITAVDPDSVNTNTITYELVVSDGQGYFTIDQNTGVITVATQMDVDDPVLPTAYPLIVRATESGPGGSASALVSFDVTIQPVNDEPPLFQENSYTTSIPESSQVNFQLPLSIVVDDGDRFTDSTIFISVEDGASVPFRVSPTQVVGSGTVTLLLTQQLDYENQQSYAFQLVATDSDGQDMTMVTVDVTDVNDNNPTFINVPAEGFYQGSINENDQAGTFVVQVMTSDPDMGENAAVVYSITGGNINTAFTINPTTGVITNNQIVGPNAPPTYTLIVTATNPTSAFPPAIGSATSTVIITVNDVNDSPPRFSQDEYTITISEAAQVGTTVTRITATDEDIPEGDQLTYAIISGNDGGFFQINPVTGDVTLLRQLDREVQPQHSLTITATDRGTPPQLATTLLTVIVQDFNDNAPQWNQLTYEVSIQEDSAPNSFVVQVDATDRDEGTNADLTFTITNGNNLPFIIDSQGNIRTAGALDRETTPQYTLLVTAIDNGVPQQAANPPATVIVNILDANDERPVLPQDSYQFTVSEDANLNTFVGQIVANDPDTTGTLTYIFTPNSPDFTFSTDGRITTAATLDATATPVYQLTVVASDGIQTSLPATVTITVEDVNNQPPVFSQGIYTETVPEDSPFQTLIVDLDATDLDNGNNGNIIYSFQSLRRTEGPFTVDPFTGVVETSAALDRETQDAYSLIVLAVDTPLNGSPMTGTATVSVIVTDVNDNAPTFRNISYERSVFENIQPGSRILTVTADDPDLGQNAIVLYRIISGNTNNMFTIDNFGNINLGATPLDREMQDSYFLIVQAYNSDLSVGTDQAAVTITVLDVNDVVPTFRQQLYFRPDLSENSPIGTPVVTVFAQDLDLDLGGSVEYSLINNPSFLSINPDSGQIFVSGPIPDNSGSRNYTMTVRATDQASPFNSNTGTVVVTVVDATVLVPVFGLPRYNFNVNENAPVDTFINQVSATLGGSSAGITYSIDPNSSPAVLDLFKIAENTGVITVDGDIDRETEDFYVFTVFADGGGVAPGSTSVWVTVNDVNDNPPEFVTMPTSPVSVEENRVGAVPLGSFRATDADAGVNAQLTFTLSGFGSNFFSVFPTGDGTGVLSAIQPLDREAQDFYELTVTATDGGNPSLSSSFPLNITVTDVNDNYPIWTSNLFQASISENNFTSNPIVTVTVSDADLPSSNNFEYTIIAGDPDGHFQINENREITQTTLLDRESVDNYQLTIQLRDPTNNPAAQTNTFVRITVDDVNDNTPEFQESVYNVNATEGPSSLGLPVVRVVADDLDAGLNSQIIYAIISQDPENHFEISPTSGLITTTSVLDKETTPTYTLVVTATDQSPMNPRTGTTTVIVTVNDINDIAPQFDRDFYGPYDVLEEISNSYIDIFQASDADEGAAGSIVYSLTGLYSDLFNIQPSTGVLTIRPDRTLDYESVTAFNITVVATDQGNPSLSSSTTVGINVININDHTPVFVGTPYTITISKNASVGQFVYSVLATDNDAGIYGVVGYDITEGDLNNIFRINNVVGSFFAYQSQTGEIFLDGQLETGTYRLVIEARDTPGDIPNSRSQTTTLTILVTDIGDLAPSFPGDGIFIGNVFENAMLGDLVPMIPTIRAVDSDATGQLIYTITGSESSSFYIDPIMAIIQVNTAQLDRETKDRYDFTVIATDSMGLTAQGTVIINVLDFNDFLPTFNESTYNFTIPENSPAGFFVGLVNAFDLDGDEVNFFIQRGSEDKFEIDSTTGVITVAPGADLDREQKAVYTLTVTVSDLRSPPLSSTATVYVYLSDINDSPPTFDSSLLDQTISIPEDTPANSLVTTISAVDDDTNPDINYEVVSVVVYDEDGNDISSVFDYTTVLSLNPVTGNLTLVSPVDREMTERFVFTVSAVDLNAESSASARSPDSAQITIIITDINDNVPEFQPPGSDVIVLQLSESVGAGNSVPGTIIALDPDQGLNGEVEYVIAGDTTGLPVFINSVTGQLILTRAIDREVQTWVNLTILAVDRGNPSLNSTIPVYIEIIDNNDNNPVFEFPTYTTSVNESAAAGTFVITVSAVDNDAAGNGRVTYSIVGGDGKFTIDPDTGVITLLEPLDKETQSQHVLTVFARDNPGDSEDSRQGSTTVTVVVLDANEYPPVVTPPVFNVEEGRPAGEVVGVIDATDPDDPDNPDQMIYYVIVGSQPAVGTTLFVINNMTGEVTTTGPLDRDNGTHPAVIYLDVLVYDGGSPDLSTPVTVVINIEDINDNDPVFTRPVYTAPVPESHPPGEVIVTVVANDPDGNSDLTYSIIDGNQNGTFIIDPSSGDIIPTKPLDYETITVYNLTVVVTDNGGQTSTTYVVIPVGDANDQNPAFIQDPYSFSVLENEPSGTEVGVVQAVDGDTQSEFADIIYTIISGDNEGHFSVNQTTGIITTAVMLDRETISEYVLVVGAHNPQPASGGFTGTASVSILVRDVNDNTPLFDSNPYNAILSSNTDVVEVHAQDPDEGVNGVVIYEIVSGNDGDLFTIDDRSGVITLVNTLDSPLVRNYTLIIVARDLGTPSLQSNTTVNIDVSYLGDNFAPRFVQPSQGQLVQIRENNAPGALVITAYAIDNDFGNNGIVDYSFLPIDDYELFDIDPSSGNITIKISADRETRQNYRLTVVATDRGNPALSTTQTFVVGILDENDNEPFFERPDGINIPVLQNLNVFENANISDLVGFITPAIDLDVGPNAVIYYYIVDGNGNGVFIINSTTGEIFVNGTLDRETLASHTIVVLATNDANYVPGSGPYNVVDNISLKEVRITLLDVDDNGPVFSQVEISACIPFDISLGGTALTVSVTDPDGASTPDVTYSIQAAVFVAGDGTRSGAQSSFRIDATTGQITTNQQFTQTHLQGYFDLVILATDNNSGQTAVTTVRICILDNNQRVVVVIDRGIDIVRDNRDILIEVLQNITGGIVFIDDITNHRDDNGAVLTDRTQVLIHVIDRTTGEVIDANVVTALIDENAMSIEVLLDDLDVVEVYPLFGGGGIGGLGILEAALLAFGILLFLGALIFCIILCCLRRRLLRKMQGGGVTLGKADNDLLKENRATSYQGSNPLWLDNDASQPDDWPDSISLLAGTTKDYEAQEATMNFLSDEVPVEVAEDAIVMTSLVSEKSIRNKTANGGAHLIGNGLANGSVSSVRRVDTTNLNGGVRTLQNSVYNDRSSSVRLQNPWAGGGGIEEERYTSVSMVSNAAPPPSRDFTDSQRSQYSSSTRSSNFVRENSNSLHHRKLLTEQAAAEIREMLQDMPLSTAEQERDLAAAAYREQMAFEAELSPITEEESISSRSTNTRASSYRDQDSLERNKRGGTITKQYNDPMGRFSGDSTLEEQYKEEEIDGANSRTSIKSYSSRRVTNKVYTGGEMMPIPELDSVGEITISERGEIRVINKPGSSSPNDAANSTDHMLTGRESQLEQQEERSSVSGSSSPKGRTYTYQVLHDSGGSTGERHSEASRSLSTHSDDSNSRTGELIIHGDDDGADEEVVEERRVKRTTIKTSSSAGGEGGSYRNYGFNDEESAL
ncbi:cadherin-23-like [Diadema antillarum]|uniref:cadherin-23-like n=1 Tax=Diadema antillarum TaxID=105358 RepID=UPI003A868069